MLPFNKYPYTDFHELNLSWVIEEMLKLHSEWDEFTAVNHITNGGEWSIEKSYTSWTIVTNDNNGYISIKPVPAGIDITNTDYWAMIFDYGDRLEDLETEVAEMSDKLDDTYDKVINHNRKGTIVMFGDSWVANSPSVMVDYIANHFGCTVKSYAWGGTGFNVEHGYKEQLNIMANDPTLDLDDVRFAIIVCGLNDHSINPPPRRSFTAAEFITAFNEWKALYNSKFIGRELPDVYWFHNYSLENWLTYPEEVVNPTDYWHQYIYYRTVRRGIRGIKSCNCFGFVEGSSDCWQTANWRHLTADGSTQYSENMCRVIDGAAPQIYTYQLVDGTFNPGDFTYPTVTASYEIIDNNLVGNMSIAMDTVGHIDTSGATATFDRYLPASTVLNKYAGSGMDVIGYNHDNKTMRFKAINNTLAGYFSGVTGRTNLTFETTI